LSTKPHILFSETGQVQKSFLTFDDVCCALCVSRRTVNYWVEAGYLKKYKVASRQVRFLIEDVERLVREAPLSRN